jgi:hypothetical protein
VIVLSCLALCCLWRLDFFFFVIAVYSLAGHFIQASITPCFRSVPLPQKCLNFELENILELQLPFLVHKKKALLDIEEDLSDDSDGDAVLGYIPIPCGLGLALHLGLGLVA